MSRLSKSNPKHPTNQLRQSSEMRELKQSYSSEKSDQSFAAQSTVVYQPTLLQSISRAVGYVLCCAPLREFTVPDYHVGIVTEFGHFKRSLNPGTYSFNPWTEDLQLVEVQRIPDLHHGFLRRHKQFIRLENPGLAFANPALDETLAIRPDVVIDEMFHGILSVNGVFKQILDPGIHVCNEFIGENIEIIPDVVIKEGYVGIRREKGVTDEKQDILDPGLYVANPMLDEKITPVDMRTVTIELKPQEVQSKNTVSITVFSILVYQIKNAYKAHCLIENIEFSLRETIKAVTHQVLSEHDLDEITAKKVQLSQNIMNRVIDTAEDWGVRILNVAIKDIIYAKDIKEALSAAAVAQRTSEATLISAKAEVEAAKYRREAAENFNSSMGLQYMYMETLKRLAESTHHSKIYFLPQFPPFSSDSAAIGNGSSSDTKQDQPDCNPWTNNNKNPKHNQNPFVHWTNNKRDQSSWGLSNNPSASVNSISNFLSVEQHDLLSSTTTTPANSISNASGNSTESTATTTSTSIQL